MDDFRTNFLNNIIKELKDQKRDYENKIFLWRRVSRETKKDGGEFAILSKNFKNADICNSVSIRPDLQIQVCDYVNGVYTKDYIEIMPCLKYYAHKDDITPDRIIKEFLIEPYFKMNIDEIFTAINEQIEKYEEYIKETEKQINDAERVFKDFSEAVDNAMSKMKQEAGNNTSLYFGCRKYLDRLY